ncbi:hypothetical protein [Nocardia gamkensis]|jgi:hypothetical protein|uniref:Uncharacterized protein n=1 Tax=Nocardia gamkensis TaxID=352869 RepID=A0A7X6R1F2_9NOCA|nr:hypothetical protein [Nocardia gamkensis]NKY25284.1 hypothetical protein [Nocardia gamkensis]NQE69436.1 hypothetical protein [Nocardia gamkensis]
MRELTPIEVAVMGDVVTERRTSWLRPTLLALLLVILGAVLVMVVVSNTDFDTGPEKTTPPPGPCEPFCTQNVAPPAQ